MFIVLKRNLGERRVEMIDWLKDVVTTTGRRKTI